MINSQGRLVLERELANFLKALPADSSVLMYLGNHVGAVQDEYARSATFREYSLGIVSITAAGNTSDVSVSP